MGLGAPFSVHTLGEEGQEEQRAPGVRAAGLGKNHPVDGDISKRYTLQFKVNAVRYSQKRVKRAQEPGGSVAISCASRVPGIHDKASLALCVTKINEMEAELSQAAQKWGTKGKKKAH